jgi:hypothetical protein
MRFVITGEWRQNRLLRLVIFLFLVFTALFWLTNAALYFHSMSLDPDVVAAHFLGKPDEFGGPAVARSYKVLLEISHAHLFSMGILIMTLTHLLLFVPAPGGLKAMAVLVTFVAALLDEASGWLIVYVHGAFSYLKVASFLVFQTALLAIIGILFAALLGRWRNAYNDPATRAPRAPSAEA